MEAGRRCEALEEWILQTVHEAKVCNHREHLFGQNQTDFSGIKTVREKFDPFNRMWMLAAEYYRRI